MRTIQGCHIFFVKTLFEIGILVGQNGISKLIFIYLKNQKIKWRYMYNCTWSCKQPKTIWICSQRALIWSELLKLASSSWKSLNSCIDNMSQYTLYRNHHYIASGPSRIGFTEIILYLFLKLPNVKGSQ